MSSTATSSVRALRRGFMLSASAAALGLSTAVCPALAQESSTLEEIVVTATRSEAMLSRAPVAVTALSGRDLIQSGVTNPLNLQDRVPGISVDRNGGLQITIRGISSTDNTEKGDPSAAFLLDGVYLARPQAQDVSFYDLDRVEVLRGPQGTLYGRNTTAGLINVISARPRPEVQASIDAIVGDFDTQLVTGMINLPLTTNTAFRLAVNYDHRDSFLHRFPGSGDNIDPARKNLSGRASLLFTPTEQLDVLLRADYSSIKGTNRENVRLSNLFTFPFVVPPDGQVGETPQWTDPSSSDRRRLTFADAQENDVNNNTWGVGGEIDWRLTESLTLSYIGSYREFERRETNSLLLGANPGFALNVPATFTGDYWQNSQELRLAFDSDRFDLQVGAYYFKERSGIELVLLGVIAPNPGDDGYVFGFPQEPTISKSLAFFGQGTFNVTDVFRLTAGVRNTHDEKSRLGATIFHRQLGEPINFTASPSNPSPDSLNLAAVDYRKTTWRAGFEYDATERTLLYGSVSTGYKAGGFNDGCLVSDANCNSPVPASALFYDPEELTAYEVGVKTRLFDNRMRIFANYFHYDYTNLQLSALSTICGGPCQVTTNAGKAKVDGVEVESQYSVDERNLFDFSVAWLDAQYKDYPVSPGVNLAGMPLNRSPKWVLTGGFQHTLPLPGERGLVFSIRSRWSDDFGILATPIRAMFRQPSFSKTDVSVTYRGPQGRYYVTAFVKNLENEATLNSAGLSPLFPGFNDGEAALSPPRTFGLRVGANW